MAITADVVLAVSINKYQGASSGSHKINVANVNPTKYPSREFKVPTRGEEIEIDASEHEWSNYFKAGYRGATNLLRKRADNGGKPYSPKSLDILVDGSVPAGGGLSSSAAFVCASTLAVLRAHGEESIDKTELVELAIVSERAVGVNSGGLDQAASVLSQRNSALHIQFHPSLQTRTLTLPTPTSPSLVFLIAQSHVVSNKHVTAPIHYNLRVVECTLAALFLASVFRTRLAKPLPTDDASPLGVSLRAFHDAFFESQAPDPATADNTNVSASEFATQLRTLLDLVHEYMAQDAGYTREEIAGVLGLTTQELEARYMSKVPVRAERFKLKQRAQHVFGEALRVATFMEVLQEERGGAEGDEAEVVKALGELVSATQASCRDLYECSCEELDELCEIAARAGAYGGRLTGAGWGGCSVFLVPGDKVEKVREAWDSEYYQKRFPEMSEEARKASVVETRPGRGSLVWQVDGREKVSG